MIAKIGKTAKILLIVVNEKKCNHLNTPNNI
jgi:hypothetical protein